MFKQIVTESIQEVADNYKLVRVAFVTTFLHTILSLITMANYFTNIMIYRMDIETVGAWERVYMLMNEFLTQGYFFELLFLSFLFFIGYFFVYPVGIGVMIKYLEEERLGSAIAAWFNLFGPLAIIHAWMAVVTLSSQTVGIYLRIIAAEIANNILMQAIMVMIAIIVIIGTILLPYSMYILSLDNPWWSAADQAQSSLKISAGLALKNLWLTIKFSLLSLTLQLRIVINILILVFVPALFMRIALQLNLVSETGIDGILYIIGGILLLIISYVNAIIDAFFTTYWYKLYIRIRE